MPSSSSHALIGGLVGAAVAAAGIDAILGGGLLDKVLIPALLAPLAAFAPGGARSPPSTGCSAAAGRDR